MPAHKSWHPAAPTPGRRTHAATHEAAHDAPPALEPKLELAAEISTAVPRSVVFKKRPAEQTPHSASKSSFTKAPTAKALEGHATQATEPLIGEK